ncbi:sn-glycerol-3-phosphate ABC transporter ATP-binding protein UgpC [Luteibacter flocculans]|uniref:Sn-glycerol-3-phosphate ABC transporter ATP-binding protein UgpC n=1 Tax=Luteibacter flocculans TaxID=2780091 RepID=A0ABY4T2F9_9GAMM|nr:sn-glycerol-3-phosphate ABC transporter ATP-binding protein UgpC [Luteibacter flocculans]URL58272.1 sn-glycerol-3-phosphate ABC transporter ATP-binding protein UgpC [Luteibacter flocculans]
MAAVGLDKVRKVYPNGHVALKEASFEIADGELLVLVGPSGCGKTTLLRMIAGLESISGGTMTIGGRVVNDVAPKDRDIAMVFQNYALYPHMTVRENLGFGLRLRGVAKEEIDRRVADASDMLGLDERLDHRPAALSGGQRQRVALGRALVRDPAVFLLDEPLSNLDAKLRLSTRVEIARIHRRLGATMVYVTHDQIEAMTLGQRIVVLNGGEIQQLDTPMNLYNKPANLFVAGFLGSPAMNLFHGTLRRADGLQVETKQGTIALGTEAPGLAAYIDRPIIVGIRPEDLLSVADHAGIAERLRAHVDVVEPVGNEVFLNMRLGSEELVARVPPHSTVQPGSEVAFGFHAERLHFFDPETTARIIAD